MPPNQALRFSLRDVFFAVTVFAILFAMAVNYPVVTIVGLFAVSPFLFAVCMAIIANCSPRLSRTIMVLLAAGLIIGLLLSATLISIGEM